MAVKYSLQVRNALLDAYEVTIGSAPRLMIYTGSEPANITGAATGTLLVELALPTDWLANASNGSKALTGNWTGVAVGTGVASYYRITNTAKTTTHEQGSVSMPAGDGDIKMNNTNVAVDQTITVPVFTKTMPA